MPRPRPSNPPEPGASIKTAGYLISTLSVALLGVASWSGLDGKPLLRLCLLLGMALSVLGMVCRWLSYQSDHRGAGTEAKPPARPAGMALSSVSRRGERA